LLLELWQASGLSNPALVESALSASAEVAGAILLKMDLHVFSSTGGITGVAILAESHISIHTWPEHGYAALDLFMCGDAMPHRAIPIIRSAFSPSRITMVEQKRGIVSWL
jgi:S-adenosylmethionine decarboxylase